MVKSEFRGKEKYLNFQLACTNYVAGYFMEELCDSHSFDLGKKLLRLTKDPVTFRAQSSIGITIFWFHEQGV